MLPWSPECKFLKDSAPVIVIHRANVINLSITFDTSPIAIQHSRNKNFCLKKEFRLKLKIMGLFLCCL